MHTPKRLLLAGSLLAVLPLSVSHAATTEATALRGLWFDECGRCHGDDGKAATALGRKLHIRDYSSRQQQAEFTDEVAMECILKGRMRGDKQVMPAFADQLSESQAKELVSYLRSLAKG